MNHFDNQPEVKSGAIRVAFPRPMAAELGADFFRVRHERPAKIAPARYSQAHES
jgi:hypothetical protein